MDSKLEKQFRERYARPCKDDPRRGFLLIATGFNPWKFVATQQALKGLPYLLYRFCWATPSGV
ncbi:hypothetical protein SCARR_03690 [Pontiella sulfatireligans]|uniref:Uncharacterized protein n=1 Tax=Pontiella sulfatireligans TaxID=2750658 RepID=A0A6C2URQ7_9BACT|nr:hypothetical protein SCARR_03690 [Pontiella sulfatireligans]